MKRSLPIILCCVLLGGCRWRQPDHLPEIEFSKVPIADAGGGAQLGIIEGRAIGARPGQQIVLFARSGAWYVQPFADQQFITILPDSTWKSATHLGTEYAALLVEPGYLPPAKTDSLPTPSGTVIVVATTPGEARLLVPMFWQSWWFRLTGGFACIFALVASYRLRIRHLTRQMNVRFEERLAERMRIAQELHDTLLQGFLSASMHMHLAVERLPDDSPVRQSLDHVQQLMERVIEEGQNTVRGLRSITADSLNLEQAFSRIQQELIIPKEIRQKEIGEQIEFRVIVEGKPRPLHPIIRDEVYRIGREILVKALRHSGARGIEIEVGYAASHLRLIIRTEGYGIESEAMQPGLDAGIRERAERIGARIKVRKRSKTGAKIELSVPGRIAFEKRAGAGN